MEFLSERNIYHGDLAARNVLLTDQLVAKVSDFGLSKRLYNDLCQSSIYARDNDVTVALPMKWLALEVLKYGQVVPTKSDVWSFGIFMWELFQIGAEPYRPGTNTLSKNHFISTLDYYLYIYPYISISIQFIFQRLRILT